MPGETHNPVEKVMGKREVKEVFDVPVDTQIEAYASEQRALENYDDLVQVFEILGQEKLSSQGALFVTAERILYRIKEISENLTSGTVQSSEDIRTQASRLKELCDRIVRIRAEILEFVESEGYEINGSTPENTDQSSAVIESDTVHVENLFAQGEEGYAEFKQRMKQPDFLLSSKYKDQLRSIETRYGTLQRLKDRVAASAITLDADFVTHLENKTLEFLSITENLLEKLNQTTLSAEIHDGASQPEAEVNFDVETYARWRSGDKSLFVPKTEQDQGWEAELGKITGDLELVLRAAGYTESEQVSIFPNEIKTWYDKVEKRQNHQSTESWDDLRDEILAVMVSKLADREPNSDLVVAGSALTVPEAQESNSITESDREHIATLFAQIKQGYEEVRERLLHEAILPSEEYHQHILSLENRFKSLQELEKNIINGEVTIDRELVEKLEEKTVIFLQVEKDLLQMFTENAPDFDPEKVTANTEKNDSPEAEESIESVITQAEAELAELTDAFKAHGLFFAFNLKIQDAEAGLAEIKKIMADPDLDVSERIRKMGLSTKRYIQQFETLKGLLAAAEKETNSSAASPDAAGTSPTPEPAAVNVPRLTPEQEIVAAKERLAAAGINPETPTFARDEASKSDRQEARSEMHEATLGWRQLEASYNAELKNYILNTSARQQLRDSIGRSLKEGNYIPPELRALREQYDAAAERRQNAILAAAGLRDQRESGTTLYKADGQEMARRVDKALVSDAYQGNENSLAGFKRDGNRKIGEVAIIEQAKAERGDRSFMNRLTHKTAESSLGKFVSREVNVLNSDLKAIVVGSSHIFTRGAEGDANAEKALARYERIKSKINRKTVRRAVSLVGAASFGFASAGALGAGYGLGRWALSTSLGVGGAAAMRKYEQKKVSAAEATLQAQLTSPELLAGLSLSERRQLVWRDSIRVQKAKNRQAAKGVAVAMVIGGVVNTGAAWEAGEIFHSSAVPDVHPYHASGTTVEHSTDPMNDNLDDELAGVGTTSHFPTARVSVEHSTDPMNDNLMDEAAERLAGVHEVVSGENLSTILHNELLNHNSLRLPEGMSRDQLAQFLYEKFPELSDAQNPTWTVEPSVWRSLGVSSGNPAQLAIGDTINIEKLSKMVQIELNHEGITDSVGETVIGHHATGPLKINSIDGAEATSVPIKVDTLVTTDPVVPVDTPIVETVQYDHINNLKPAPPLGPNSFYINPLEKGEQFYNINAGGDVSNNTPEFPTTIPLSGNSLESPSYKSFIDNTFGGRPAFNRIVAASVHDVESKTYDMWHPAKNFNSPMPSVLEVGSNSTKFNLSSLTIADIENLRKTIKTPELARQFCEQNNFKYETWRAWEKQIDTLTDPSSGLPFIKNKTTFGDLYSRAVADKVMKDILTTKQ